MRPFDPEVAQQRSALRGLLLKAHRAGHPAAARVADPVVADEAVPVAEGRLLHEGREPVRADPGVGQDHRLAGPAGLVLELDPVHQGPFHQRSGGGDQAGGGQAGPDELGVEDVGVGA
jgi:hypothetical protein